MWYACVYCLVYILYICLLVDFCAASWITCWRERLVNSEWNDASMFSDHCLYSFYFIFFREGVGYRLLWILRWKIFDLRPDVVVVSYMKLVSSYHVLFPHCTYLGISIVCLYQTRVSPCGASNGGLLCSLLSFPKLEHHLTTVVIMKHRPHKITLLTNIAINRAFNLWKGKEKLTAGYICFKSLVFRTNVPCTDVFKLYRVRPEVYK